MGHLKMSNYCTASPNKRLELAVTEQKRPLERLGSDKADANWSEDMFKYIKTTRVTKERRLDHSLSIDLNGCVTREIGWKGTNE